ncbi:MAG: zf-TFIIB domain-containing protein [Chthonomonas sp.]|nr:zf-TFIIB domain-containing protein [Chthonomonas sp.]
MKLCPTCSNVALTPVQRSGIELDYCSTCRGVWLDRGELEKLLAAESVGAMHAAAPPMPGYGTPPPPREERRDRDDYDDRKRYDDDDYYSKKKRKKGLFSEIFDFD